MNDIKKVKYQKIKEQAPNEIPAYVKAVKLIDKIYGVSHTQDQHTLEEIRKVLKFEPAIKEGKQLKQGILDKATKKASEGMNGEGLFFIN
tara:strand:+ start:235 stop:504 length:270 start_codon:yes stop_codon:yes gene_type:complete